MKIGYARVSTDEQSGSTQLDALKAAGCDLIYLEKCNGKPKHRAELERMFDTLR
ncbi:recombinase family protein [Pseudoalteromonas sp. B5MOD-1]